MLSFKALSERKTKVKINPKQAEITEKDECNHTKTGMKCPTHGMKPCPDTEISEVKKTGSCGKPADECMCDKKEKTPAQKSVEGKSGMSEAKKKDDSYLEVDFKKRQKNNEKARKEMDKVPSQKNPHFESTGDQAYGSQEEVSEESTEEVAETETLLTFKQYVSEEGADSLKDRRMERGGVDGNNRYKKPVSNTPNTFGKKKPKYDGMSALDKVKAKIEKQYGKGAIMDTKKKK